MKSDRALWEERGEIWAVPHVYASTHARRARITRAHYRDFALFAFTTFTQRDYCIAILGQKKPGDKRKTWEISEKMSNVFRKISHVFWKRSNVFEERSEKLFPRILFMAPNVSKAPSKSLEISPIVQTLCAKDGNQYIFTSSSWGGDLSPSKRIFWREFRVWFTTL